MDPCRSVLCLCQNNVMETVTDYMRTQCIQPQKEKVVVLTLRFTIQYGETKWWMLLGVLRILHLFPWSYECNMEINRENKKETKDVIQDEISSFDDFLFQNGWTLISGNWTKTKTKLNGFSFSICNAVNIHSWNFNWQWLCTLCWLCEEFWCIDGLTVNSHLKFKYKK